MHLAPSYIIRDISRLNFNMRFSFLAPVAALIASAAATRRVFVDNDGLDNLNIILPLLGEMDVVGVSASFGDPSLVDALGSAAEVLSNFSMESCIPLYAGAETPLLRTKKTFAVWEELFGEFVWKGSFDPDYVDTYNITDIEYDDTTPAAMALINAVKKYPGEVEIYAAGLMTTVAQAVSMWPGIVDEVKALWIMGGYIDGQYPQVTGGDLVDDINTDFNLMFDPEAAQIVLTAGFKEVYIGGNVTNYIYPTQELYDTLIDKFGSENITTEQKYAAIDYFVGNGNASQVTLPLWDQAVSGFMAFPELIKSTTDVYVAVDTAFSSPFYGDLRIWAADLKPSKGSSGKAIYVDTIDVDALLDKIADALSKDWTLYCSKGGPLNF